MTEPDAILGTVEEKKPVVLIVDDLPLNIQVLGKVLQHQPIEIAVAMSGADAVAYATATPPDLVLLDIMMPDMDGFEVCQKLKSMAATAEIPVIFVSARTEIESVLQGFKQGGVDYITKPFRNAEIIARVKTQLELQRHRRILADMVNKLEQRNQELEKSLAHIKTLQGLLPICMHCHKIRSDKESWERMEKYIMEHSNATFTHSICPECMQKHYGQYMKKN
jgi:PleD family two-component response regulator